MPEESNIKLTLQGGGLSYSGSVTLLQAAEIVRVASLAHEELLMKNANTSAQNYPAHKPSLGALALPEVLNLAKPTTSPETIAVIATWIMDTEQVESVSRADVSARYRDARLPLPGNFPRDFSQAVRKGFLAPVRGNNDQFYVTKTGRALLDSKEQN